MGTNKVPFVFQRIDGFRWFSRCRWCPSFALVLREAKVRLKSNRGDTDVSAEWNEKWSCEIMEDPCWFLDELWWLLTGFLLFFKGFKNFAGFLGAAGPPVAVAPLAFAFPVNSKCEIEVESMWNPNEIGVRLL